VTAQRIPSAALELKVSEATLRRWIARGAPVARRGRRGRGGAALIDVGAIEAWRGSSCSTDAVRVFASELPELVADAVDGFFRAISGPHKRELAAALAGTWYVVTTRLLDRLRRDCGDIPEVDSVPQCIERLRQIGHK